MSASVVALGAVCELKADSSTGFGFRPGEVPQRATLGFSLVEFADLDDGQRLVLRADRGWRSALHAAYKKGSAAPPPPLPFDVSDPWLGVTRERLTKNVMATLDPDDDEQHHRWLVDRLAELGVAVEVEVVATLPFRVELGQLLEDELCKRGDSGPR